MRPHRCIHALLVAFVLSSAASAHAALRLVYEVDGYAFELAEVSAEGLQIRREGKTEPLPAGGTWKLDGDVRENARLFRWTPSYGIDRPPNRGALVDPERALIGHVSMRHELKIGDKKPEAFAEFLDDWPDGAPDGGAIVFVWLVDARPTQVAVKAVPASTLESFFVDADFKLTMAEARGQPVLLLWRDGKFVAPQPIFSQPNGAEALVATLLDDADGLSRILKRGFKASSTGRLEVNLMHYAAEACAVHTMDVLLAAEPALPSRPNADGTLPQHWAAADGRSESITRLAAAGAPMDKPRTRGGTPLMDAVRHGHLETVRTFLAAGISPNTTDAFGRGPLNFAMWYGYPDIAELLLDGGAADGEMQDIEPSLLIHNCSEGNIEMVHWLLEHGADPKARYRGSSPLLAASYRGNREIVSALLAGGADPNTADPAGTTPLMAAAMANHGEVGTLLLDSGAEIDATTLDGSNALHVAARHDAPPFAQLLLDRGLSADIRDVAGLTALELALVVHSRFVADSLLLRGVHLDPAAATTAAAMAAAIRMDDALAVKSALDGGWSPETGLGAGLDARQLAEFCGARQCLAILRRPGAAAAKSVPGIVPLRDLDRTPSIVRAPTPDDPRDPWSSQREESVRVEVVIDADGFVRAPRILETSDRPLAAATLKSLQQWRFIPGASGGRDVATRLEFSVSFPDSEHRIYETWQTQQAPTGKKPRPPFRATRPDGTLPPVDALVYRFVVDATGSVGDVEILRSAGPEIDASLIASVKREEFTPGTRNGKPVAVRVTRRFWYKQDSP